MDDTKYSYRNFGENTFRIYLKKMESDTFGIIVKYEIQEPVSIPRNAWERLKQFFTVESYHWGYWIPLMSDDTLEDCINQAMASIVKTRTNQNAAEKEWEALQKSFPF